MRTPVGLEPPDFLQLAGHPLRWRLLGELARSDRTVHELTARVAEAQNLVSYHLGKLRDAGLVSSRRSSADGRDAYYAIDLARIGALLSATAGALHPGLGVELGVGLGLDPTAPSRIARHEPADAVTVLFLCTGNSARSQMAEALTRVRSAGAVRACSAGSHPKPMHPNAVRVMRDEHGIDLRGQQSKHLDVFTAQTFDWVITLCDRVREVCPEFPGEPEAVHWSMADPSAGRADAEDSYPAFQQTAAELETRIGFLLPVLTEGRAGVPSRRRSDD